MRAITSGPAANVYINLQGREPAVAGVAQATRAEYVELQRQVAQALRELQDENALYTGGRVSRAVFDKVYTRPLPNDINDPRFGRMTSDVIGQDSGDVFALLTVGYNFDGTQSPVVPRLGDGASVSGVLSVPNFYGAHGYDPALPEMSAIFYAAGPDVRRGVLQRVRNIDVAPTIARLLGVEPPSTVDGKPIPLRIARAVKRGLLADLTALPPTGDRTVDHALEQVADRLSDVLDDELWQDDATPSRRGQQIFGHDERALALLAGLDGAPAAVQRLAAGVAAIDQELAAAAVDAAEEGDLKKLARAREHLARGDVALAAGKFLEAVESYRRGWAEAVAAARHGRDDGTAGSD